MEGPAGHAPKKCADDAAGATALLACATIHAVGLIPWTDTIPFLVVDGTAAICGKFDFGKLHRKCTWEVQKGTVSWQRFAGEVLFSLRERVGSAVGALPTRSSSHG
jgi:hypothetical protein